MLLKIGLIEHTVNFKFSDKLNRTDTQNQQFLLSSLYRKRHSYLKHPHKITLAVFQHAMARTEIIFRGLGSRENIYIIKNFP
jgi:hypothetical protein